MLWWGGPVGGGELVDCQTWWSLCCGNSRRYLGSSANPPPPLCAVPLLKGRVPMHRDANRGQEWTEACGPR